MEQSNPSPLERAKMQVDTLARITELRAEGLSCRRISTILQSEGRVGPHGGRWSFHQVAKFIRSQQAG